MSTSAQMIFVPAAETRVEGAGASTEKRKYLRANAQQKLERIGPKKNTWWTKQNKKCFFQVSKNLNESWLCQDAGSRLVSP